MAELSFYALNITSISDLIQQQNLLEETRPIATLRVMHCGGLCDINGIQIKMFAKLRHLNLSSNMIEDIGELTCLHQVQELNLSCNQIWNVRGLENMLHCLEKLNLSHNRIAGLDYFKKALTNGQVAPNLTQIDLNDNYIGDIDQISYFKPVISLKELIL